MAERERERVKSQASEGKKARIEREKSSHHSSTSHDKSPRNDRSPVTPRHKNMEGKESGTKRSGLSSSTLGATNKEFSTSSPYIMKLKEEKNAYTSTSRNAASSSSAIGLPSGSEKAMTSPKRNGNGSEKSISPKGPGMNMNSALSSSTIQSKNNNPKKGRSHSSNINSPDSVGIRKRVKKEKPKKIRAPKKTFEEHLSRALGFHTGNIVLRDPRAIEACQALDLQPWHLKRLRAKFDAIDIDGSGNISYDEFFEAVGEERTPFTDKLFALIGTTLGYDSCHCCRCCFFTMVCGFFFLSL